MLTSSRFGLIMLATSVAFSLEAAASGLTWLNCSQTEVKSYSVAASEGTTGTLSATFHASCQYARYAITVSEPLQSLDFQIDAQSWDWQHRIRVAYARDRLPDPSKLIGSTDTGDRANGGLIDMPLPWEPYRLTTYPSYNNDSTAGWGSFRVPNPKAGTWNVVVVAVRDDCDCIGRCGTSVASCKARKQSYGSSTVVNQNRNRRLTGMYSTSEKQKLDFQNYVCPIAGWYPPSDEGLSPQHARDIFSPDQSYQACNSDPLTVNVVVNKLSTKETVLDLGDIEPGPFISQAKVVDIQPGDWVTPNAGNGLSYFKFQISKRATYGDVAIWTEPLSTFYLDAGILPGPEHGLSLFTNEHIIAFKARQSKDAPAYYSYGDGDPDVVARETAINKYSPVQFTVNSDRRANDNREDEIFGPGIYTYVANYGFALADLGIFQYKRYLNFPHSMRLTTSNSDVTSVPQNRTFAQTTFYIGIKKPAGTSNFKIKFAHVEKCMRGTVCSDWYPASYITSTLTILGVLGMAVFWRSLGPPQNLIAKANTSQGAIRRSRLEGLPFHLAWMSIPWMIIALMPHPMWCLWFKLPIVVAIAVGAYGLRSWNYGCLQFFTFCTLCSIPLSVFIIIVVFGHAVGGYGDSTWHLFHWLAGLGCAFTSCCATGVSIMLCTALSDLNTLRSAPTNLGAANVVQIVTQEGDSVAVGGVVPSNAIVQGQVANSGGAPVAPPSVPMATVVKGTVVEGKAIDV